MSDLVVHKNNFLETSGGLELPAIITNAGEHAARRFVEFFVATIRNKNTRMAYARAVYQFMDWCDERGLELDTIEPIAVAAYVEQKQKKTTKRRRSSSTWRRSGCCLITWLPGMPLL